MADNIWLGAKVSICATPQTATLSAAGYEALTFVEIGDVVTPPSISEEVGMPTQQYVNRTRAAHQKGVYTGAASEIVVGYDYDDAGQLILYTASRAKGTYAIKVELTDSPNTVTHTNTVVYARVLVGPRAQAGGAAEDFVNHSYPIQVTIDEPVVVPVEPV